MKRRILCSVVTLYLVGVLFAFPSYALMGDADGNGVLDLDDARVIAKFVANQVPALPNPTDADATQDGTVDMEDAFIIAKKITGQTRIVVIAPRYGRSDKPRIGEMIRIDVFEKFFPFNITGGTVRIQSASTGYDSGDQPLTFEHDGRSLYYHWDTTSLEPAADYDISVTLTTADGQRSDPIEKSGQTREWGDTTISLGNHTAEPFLFAATIDAFCPAPGIPLVFRRIVHNSSPYYPYLGPLGRGWVHNYDLFLEEHTDGRVVFLGPENIGRFFKSNADGTYSASPGDYGVLTRDPDGTFQLQEKNGLIYRFRSDLRVDYIKDLNGNRIDALYDAGRLVEIRHSCGKSFFLEYNASGRITRLTDHAGRVTRYEYDPGGFLLKKVIDPAEAVTEYTYWTPDTAALTLYLPATLLEHRLLSVAYPDGTYMHNEYDKDARLIKQTGTWGANPVTYRYDEDGKTHIIDAVGAETVLTVNGRGQPLTIVDPDQGQTQMQYDSAANLRDVSDPLNHVSRMGYDEFGNLTWITTPAGETVQYGYDLRFNQPSWVKNPLGKTTTFAYDDHGNLTTVTYPDTSQESYTYDIFGNVRTFLDGEGKQTRFYYLDNDLEQLSAIKNELGHLTHFSYKETGDLASVIDAKGHQISYEYDPVGRLTSRTYPGGSSEGYEYDNAGKPTAFTNRRGESITFSYDATGRLEWKIYPSGKKLHFFYDDRGLLSLVEKESGGTTTLEAYYEYDLSRRLRLTKVPGKTATETYDVSYAYDAAGNRKALVYPDGYTLNYEYDAADRLRRITDGSGSMLVAYEYDAAGRRKKKTLGNGTYTTYEYDDLDQLKLLVNYSPDGAAQSPFAYTYNKTGIRTSMTTLEGTHNYSYDDIYQLTGVTYPDGKTVDYAFDEVGNRGSVTDDGGVTSYAVNDLDQYTQVGTETFGYDGNGNLSTSTSGSEVTTYDWDEEDGLVSLDRGAVHIEYQYDYQGRLMAKTIDDQEIRYVWDGLYLIAEMDSAGNVLKRYVYGAAIDEVLVVTVDNAKYWAQQDGLGSVVGTTNNSGVVIATSSYDVYGNIRDGNLNPVPQRLAGMIWDEDAGLYYVRARWYNPIVGRFLTHDAIVQYMYNNYSYCQNNPVNCSDPLGLMSQADNELQQIRQKVMEYLHKKFEAGYTWGRKGKYSLWDLAFDNHIKCSKMQEELLKEIGKLLKENNYKNWEVSRGEHRWNIPKIPGIKYDYYATHFFIIVKGRDGSLWTIDPWNRVDPKTLEGDPIRPWEERDEIYEPYDIDDIDNIDEIHGAGLCPTFIQPPSYVETITTDETRLDVSREQLAGKITVPIKDALLRSDIPIFGVAGGENFKAYRVEYGLGSNPSEWHLIEESTIPQPTCDIGFAEAMFMQGDLDIRGNLATWNVGLKNWVHLPWHPPEDPTDLNGVYTIRLVVEGKDGEIVEDRVTGEVGRVIAQCLPGIAVSPDQRVVMRFPEQALTHPFRVYTILPLAEAGEQEPPAPEGAEFIGPVYRIREPGDRFIKDVSLEFQVSQDELETSQPEHIGLARYDTTQNTWIWLESFYDQESQVFKTSLNELPETRAIYALIHSPQTIRSTPASALPEPRQPLEPVRPGVLLDNTFEESVGTFKTRDRLVGATLFRENTTTPDGSYCLKATNENHSGNFSLTVLDRPFDVREYGIMSFDYRLEPQTKIDLSLKVNECWYTLRFTGDVVDYRHQDVNIANLGTIEGIVADDQWHTANIDLRYFLRQHTRHTRIEEIVLANWTVGGYMKLDFGNNPRGATYYIDNFKIIGSGNVEEVPPVLLVDNFDAAKSLNLLGEPSGTYCNPGARYIQETIVDVPPSSETVKAENSGHDRALQLSFDMIRDLAYGGYWTTLKNQDLSAYNSLRFKLKADGAVPPIKIGIRNVGGIEGKTLIAPYASPPGDDGWQEVHVPLTGLYGLIDFSTPEVLFLAVSHEDKSGKGTIWIDDLMFDQTQDARVANFDSPFSWNLMGGEYTTHQNGAAAISENIMPDVAPQANSDNMVYRISYGGSIGRDYGVQGGFSYAIWKCGLNGIDARPFEYLTFRMRGEQGEEIPNFYLSDTNKRICLRAREIDPVTNEWQTIRLPLEYFAEQGIDLSHLDGLEIVFEWEAQSGTIYVDDIEFQ